MQLTRSYLDKKKKKNLKYLYEKKIKNEINF